MKEVAILMAVYRPNLDFFKAQLQSLNAQDYPKLTLYVCDDSQDAQWFETISGYLRTYVTNFSYVYLANPQNLGSNKTFERLTKLARADYFAYCDQDDIWHADKISRLVALMRSGVGLAYSDLRVIDAQNQEISPLFSQYNKRIKPTYGTSQDTFAFFLRRNCVTGCAMLIQSDLAKLALPFNEDFVHDHWLALVAASQGDLAFCPDPLIDYRIHGANQIGRARFKGIAGPQDYLSKKLLIEARKNDKLKRILTLTDDQSKALQEVVAFLDCRIAWFEKPSLVKGLKLLAYLPQDPSLVAFELLIRSLPQTLGQRFFARIKEK